MTGRGWLGVLTAVAVLAGGAFLALRAIRPSRIAAGTLEVEWRGAFRGRATLPARITWCPITRLGTLEAISHDTGLLVSLRERDTLTLGVHPVLSPDLGGDLPLPAAVASLRWVRDTATILGFRGQSGAVDLEAVSRSLITGSFDIAMQRAFRSDTLRVRGNFRDLPVVATAVGCP